MTNDINEARESKKINEIKDIIRNFPLSEKMENYKEMVSDWTKLVSSKFAKDYEMSYLESRFEIDLVKSLIFTIEEYAEMIDSWAVLQGILDPEQ